MDKNSDNILISSLREVVQVLLLLAAISGTEVNRVTIGMKWCDHVLPIFVGLLISFLGLVDTNRGVRRMSPAGIVVQPVPS